MHVQPGQAHSVIKFVLNFNPFDRERETRFVRLSHVFQSRLRLVKYTLIKVVEQFFGKVQKFDFHIVIHINKTDPIFNFAEQIQISPIAS